MTINKKTQEQTETKLNKKSFILASILILGIIVLVFLSLNFTFTYQLKNLEQEIQQSFNKSESIPKAEINNVVDIAAAEKNYDACKELLNFTQDYYKMKLKIEQGQAFENELNDLNKYSFNSNELKKSLLSLNDINKSNVSDAQLNIKFSAVIKDLYKANRQDNILYHYLSKLIFIRPIDERAIANGGMDMEIVLTEQALSKKDFVKAKIHMDKLPNNLESLNDLKLDLQHKLDIMNYVEAINNILANRDCQIMSK